MNFILTTYKTVPFSQYLLFWTAIFDRSAYAGISVAVFFITLDSCLTLRLRLRYSDRIKTVLRALLIVSSFFVSVTTLVTYALQPYRNDPGLSVSLFRVEMVLH